MDFNDIINDEKSSSTKIAFNIIKWYNSLNNKNVNNLLDKIKYNYYGMAIISYICDYIKNNNNTENLIEKINKNIEKSIINSDKIINKNSIIGTLSYSSVVLNSFIRNKNNIKSVYVLESMPELEGISFARILLKNNINVILLHDSEIYEMAKNVDYCIIGSDLVSYNGTLIHKTGTYPLAMAMNDNNKDVYSFTIKEKISKDFKTDDYNKIKNHKWDIEINSINKFFDITDSKFISYYITENGFIKPGKIKNLL